MPATDPQSITGTPGWVDGAPPRDSLRTARRFNSPSGTGHAPLPSPPTDLSPRGPWSGVGRAGGPAQGPAGVGGGRQPPAGSPGQRGGATAGAHGGGRPGGRRSGGGTAAMWPGARDSAPLARSVCVGGRTGSYKNGRRATLFQASGRHRRPAGRRRVGESMRRGSKS
ncbi:hypothetical protein MRB53_042219 [Persea americana]|nr:hypothetical protein MRB53_042213 [Persea americana]KAJ8603258.1 hypothetical protein MRB53_042219 [Persea americana]